MIEEKKREEKEANNDDNISNTYFEKNYNFKNPIEYNKQSRIISEYIVDTLELKAEEDIVQSKIEEQPTKDKTGKTKNVTNKEQKLRERELKIREDELTQEELATDMKLVDYELMTKKEFREKWSEYMKRKK